MRPRPGAQAALGRAVVARGPAQGGPAACAGGAQRVRGGAAAKRRRRSADSGGERVEKHEQAAGKLTGGRFGAEDGRKVVVDERGEARGGASMVDGGLVRDFGRVGAQLCSWVVGVGGRRVCAAPGATNRGGVVSRGRRGGRRRLGSIGSPELEERERTVGTGSFQCDREDKNGARTTRIAGGRDAWRCSPTARRRHGRPQWKRCSEQ